MKLLDQLGLQYLIEKFKERFDEVNNTLHILVDAFGGIYQDINRMMPTSGGILGNYSERITVLGPSSGIIDLSLGNVFQHSPSVNTAYTITNPMMGGVAQSFTLIITQSSTVRTLTFPSSVIWQGGEIPDLTTPRKTYVLTFMTTDGGAYWLGMFGGEF